MTFFPVIPVSGVGGLRFLDETQDQQLETLKADPEIARETEYFRENIASATTSDALLADRRLLQVALTAYGLESEIDKTAFIKEVLDGGVDNPASFANRLNDQRWFELAKDFGYGDPNAGLEVTGFRAAVEIRFRPDGTPDPTADDIDAAQLATFRANIDSVQSVDDLLADPTTLDVALAAFGLERGFFNDNHFRQLLTEGVGTGSYAQSLEPDAWVSFANAFQGLADGRDPVTHTHFEFEVARELSRLNIPPLASQTEADADSTRISEAEFETFKIALETAATPEAALENEVVLEVVRAAYGLTADAATDAEARALLTAAASGDLSLAFAQTDEAWTRAAQAFQATWTGGEKQFVSGARHAIELAIADADLETLSFIPQPASDVPTVDAAELAYFQENADDIDSASDLVNDARLLDVALRAFGLENETDQPTDAQLIEILEQDPTDPLATVNQFDNPAWVEFADAFAPPTDGSEVLNDIWQYGLEERLIANGAPQEDLDYLRRRWSLIDLSIDLVIDEQLMDITLSAFGIEKGTLGANFVLTTLLSDVSDPNSFVNRFGDPKLKEFAEFFQGGPRSNVREETFQTQLVDDYHNQVFEVRIGQQDENLRLALNFRREIGEIAEADNVSTAGWFNILASQPLRTVLDGAFGLPDEFVQLDIADQEIIYRDRAQQLFGSSDASVFTDPANVETALERFLARSGNALPAASSSILTLVNQTAAFATAGFNSVA